MRRRLTVSAADTNCLISQLISDGKHRSLQQIPAGGEADERRPALNARPEPQLRACGRLGIADTPASPAPQKTKRLPGSYRPGSESAASYYPPEQVNRTKARTKGKHV